MTTAHPENERLSARASVLLDGLEQLPVGPGLHAGLAGLRAVPLDSAAAVRATVLWDRLVAHCQAQSMITVHEAVEGPELAAAGVRDRLQAIEVIGEELAALSHVSSRVSVSRVGLTTQVGATLPASWEALDRGEITLEHLRRLARETAVATPRVAATVDAQLIPLALSRGWTPGKLATEARKAVIVVDPDGAATRARAAKADADVRLFPGGDETATLDATGDGVVLRRVMDAINQRAAHLTGAATGEGVGDGQAKLPAGLARFNAMADLILGPQPGHAETRRAPAAPTDVLLTMDLTTWLGLTQHPGQVTGVGPISPQTARELTKDAGFRLMLTDPVTGATLALGRTRYRPTTALRRFIAARDRTCRFPGCQQPATHADVDHRREWDPNDPNGGTTDPDNLHALCRRHHNLKTRKLWHVDCHPDGSETWTSPLGFAHTRRPSTYRLYVLPPPEDLDEPPEDIANRIPTQRDPNPPSRIDDPLPDHPTPTLEDYLTYTDDLERRLIQNFLADCLA